ncbi:prolipoprotein diacylglyceryl transferase [soil metagenome]
MHPVLFEIRGFEITSFGALVAIGALIGLWIFRGELRRSRLPESAVDAALAGVIGGMVGAKLLWTLEHLGTDQWTALLFSRGGMSWFGGFGGGVLAAMMVMRRQHLRVMAIIAAATPALAIGHAIGRVGCLLVGDDYGTPTTLPWAIAFPRGLPPTDVPVHPTQIYEAIGLMPIAAVLVHLRHRGADDRSVVGLYLVLTAATRFAIQWIREYDPFLGPFGFAHLAALVVMAAGAYLLLTPASSSPERPRHG